jgi:hypothetical protein
LATLYQSRFPCPASRGRTRKQVSTQRNRIRHLRNRVFHHEPIWYWHDLAQQHLDTLETIETIEWIEPARRQFVQTNDQFPEAYQRGVSFY